MELERESTVVPIGAVYESRGDLDNICLETGKVMASGTPDRYIPLVKKKSAFLVYLLLALSYLLIIILFGLVISNELRLPSQVARLHRQQERSKDLFPCGSRSREWQYYDGRCYFFSTQEATWHTAKSHCEERNSTLVVVHDQPKQNFLQSQTRNARYWIGLSDENTEGQWRWIDGTDYLRGFKYWKQGEPNDHQSVEDCTQIFSSGEWNDMPCNYKAFYICEKPLPS
ncbi:hypothetical protein JRQ81_003773 [Phrynocephalus forsythii]|uniref:C-type lectin domain-containing protein n=1 Tax=Phrynocephalus forsythii TaxID=171643 RepID=A0A9Q1AXI4_9SAUR|nr:hypothetical protein JRQ81_003773 [Phrynocephalus forsythii]